MPFSLSQVAIVCLTHLFFLQKTDKHIQPFHEDFEAQFIKYCPDVAKKFPTDFALVSKMIQTFISNAIDSKEIGPLAKRFAKR
eukprot:1369685-Amorphochlora_amoeboformis.AAC.2